MGKHAELMTFCKMIIDFSTFLVIRDNIVLH